MTTTEKIQRIAELDAMVSALQSERRELLESMDFVPQDEATDWLINVNFDKIETDWLHQGKTADWLNLLANPYSDGKRDSHGWHGIIRQDPGHARRNDGVKPIVVGNLRKLPPRIRL